MVKHSDKIEERAGPLQCLRMAGAILRMVGEPLALESSKAEEIDCLDDSGNFETARLTKEAWIKGKGLSLDQMAECGAFCTGHDLIILTSSGDIWVWSNWDSEPVWWHEGEAWITAVAGHPVLPLIATGHEDGMVQIWDAKTGKILFQWQDSQANRGSETDGNAGISNLEWHPTVPKLMFADEHLVIRGLDFSSKKIQFELPGHKGRIVGLAWDPLNRYVFSAGWDGTVRVWNPESGRPVILLNDHGPLVTAIAVSGDGKWLIAGDSLPSCNLWEIGSWKRLWRPVPLVAEPRFARFLPGNHKVVLALADGRVIGFDTDPAEKDFPQGQLRFEDNPGRGFLSYWGKQDWICLLPQGGTQFWQRSKQLVGGVSTHQASHLADFKGPVRALDLAAESCRMVTAHFRPGILRCWDISKGAEDHQCSLVSIQDSVPGAGELLAIHPAGDFVVAGSQVAPDLGIYSLPFLQPTGLLIEPLRGNSIQDFHFSRDGSRLAVCGIGTLGSAFSQGMVVLFNTVNWEPVTRLDMGFWRLCWHPEEPRLALASPDGSLMEWWPESGRCRHLKHVSESPFSILAYTPDGNHLAAACGAAEMVIFDCLNDLPSGIVVLPGQIAAMSPGANGGEMGILLSGGDGWLLDIPTWLAESNSQSR